MNLRYVTYNFANFKKYNSVVNCGGDGFYVSTPLGVLCKPSASLKRSAVAYVDLRAITNDIKVFRKNEQPENTKSHLLTILHKFFTMYLGNLKTLKLLLTNWLISATGTSKSFSTTLHLIFVCVNSIPRYVP